MKKQTFEQLLGDNYKKVNMLTAIKEVDDVLQGKLLRRRVECLCDCGNTTTISIDHYKRGKIISCGCHLKDIMKARAKELAIKWKGRVDDRVINVLLKYTVPVFE